MAGILSALGTVTEILDKSDGNLTGKKLLETIKSKEVQLLRADGSMMKLLGKYIVEPVIVVSKDLRQEEIIDNIIGIHTDLFAGFYLQAFDILRAHFGIEDPVAIDALSTDNGGLERVILKGVGVALEGRDFTSELLNGDFTISIEALKTDDELEQEYNMFKTKENYKKEISDAKDKQKLKADKDKDDKKLENDLVKDKLKREQDFYGRDREVTGTKLHSVTKDFTVPSAIIRTLEITMRRPIKDATTGAYTGGTMTVVIPVTIKAHVIFTDVLNILNAMEPNSEEKYFFNRIDEYRSGAVSLWDLMFAGDLIRQYKQTKLKDKDDLLKIIQNRVVSSNSKIVDNNFSGFEKYYNMYIISATDLIKLENRLHGKISDIRYKQKFLDQTFGLGITVVDQDHELIRIQLRDLTSASTVTFKSAVKSDKKGNDIGEVVKALVGNKPMVF